MRRFVVALVIGTCVLLGMATKASALAAFKVQFQKLYLTADSDKEFAKTVKSNLTGCFVCHQGKNRKHHNPYGEELTKLITKKDVKDTKKVIASLRKVEKMHTDPNDENSPTYGDLIKENKLPGGPLDEVKKEPEGPAVDTPPNPGAGP